MLETVKARSKTAFWRSKGESAARHNTATTHEDWALLRERLQQDHSKPGSRALLINAWRKYVANSFEQPAAAAAGSSSIVGAEQGSIFDLADDDDVEAPPPPPSPG